MFILLSLFYSKRLMWLISNTAKDVNSENKADGTDHRRGLIETAGGEKNESNSGKPIDAETLLQKAIQQKLRAYLNIWKKPTR